MGRVRGIRPEPDDGFRGWDLDDTMRGHWVVAIVAALLSVVIHGAMAWLAAQVDFSFLTGRAYEVPVRRFDAVSVDRVTYEGDTAPILEALRALEAVGAGAVDLEQSLEAHQMPPDAAAIEPPALRAPEVELDLDVLSDAELPPLETAWQPRQEIIAIETKAVTGPDLPLPRREIPAIHRMPAAPDIVLPIDTADIPVRSEDITQFSLPEVGQVPRGSGSLSTPTAMLDTGPSEVPVQSADQPELFEETPEEITDVAPIERTLQAQVETYMLPGETHGYFRLTIERAGAEVLPVMPKDVLLVQDTSATIAERRLHFSRQGFRRGFRYITPQDRFNIATFVDRTSYAFPDWAFRSAESDAKAQQYLDDMTVEGNTDFLAAMRDILALETDPDRPAIVIVVTDGLMHSGVTDSTEVIAQFTHENAGRMSIFTLGLADYANRYLLDMLSHFNMGEARYVQAGRWDIPDDLVDLIGSVSRPVLGDLRVRFGADTEIEGYPLRPGNLYLDRPLVIYGRFARAEERLVFHAAGRAGVQRSDMVFDLPLPTPQADATIRKGWSQQKMYSLIALYTQTRDRRYLREMTTIARRYGHPVPFRTIFGL